MERLLLSLVVYSMTTGAFAAHPHLENPLHHVSVTVSRQGARVRGIGAGHVQFSPEALVVDGRAHALHPGAAVAAGARISQPLGQGVSAWYLNTPFGIEQGFVLAKPQAGKQVGIRMVLGGDLLPSHHGSGLDFSALKDPKPTLHYSRVVAYDADHRRLPS